MLRGMFALGWLRALVLAELLVALAAAAALWGLRVQTVEGELRTLASLARAMSLQADRTLGLADTVLRTTRDELMHGLLVPGTLQADALLRARVAPLQAFRAMSVFDEEGQRIATSRPSEAASPRGVSGSEFFRVARRATEPSLYITTPYVAQTDGQQAISATMNWTDAEGRFRGVMALIAAPDFLEGEFGRIAATADTRMAVHRLDGTPLREGPAGDTLAPAQVQALGAHAGGSVAAETGAAGDRRRLAAAAVLEHYPLMVVISRDAKLALAAWSDMAWLVGAFVASALLVTLGLALRIAHDQLRRERLEDRLQRSRKLEALGKLAGGVAHDFNNILAAVIGFGEVARQAAPEGSKQAHHLDQVLQAGQRGKAVVERILAFSRGQPRRVAALRLQPVVAEVLDHLGGSLRDGVRVLRELRAPDLVVRGDATAVYEAVMNLCTNALQAMPEGGLLRVSLDEQEVRHPLVLYDSTLDAGRYARLVVADDGAGMGPEVLARLFEPFFTTRGPRGGTGLGLAVVHGVVTEMKGAIDVTSHPGAGSTFTLYLPVSADSAVPAPLPEPEPPAGRGQTILVVDDEPLLAELAEELLAGLGYEAFGLSSSVQALEEFKRDPSRFDLVLTDEVMPGMTGTALARELRRIRPDLPVVLVSGYGGPQLEARAAEAGIRIVATKPLTRAELARSLARAWRG